MAFDSLEDLVGRSISGVSFNDRRDLVVFDTDSGPLIYDALGDCCSVSWFEHVTGLEALIGEVVLTAETIDLPEPPEDPERDVVAAYGYRLTTAKGRFELEMRNESNGYYGGWIERREKAHVPVEPVTEDF